MLDDLRGPLGPALRRAGGAFAAAGLPPTFWTALSFALACASGLAYWLAGPLAGGALLLASGALDIVDGQVARISGRESRRGAFLDSFLDRASEIAVFAGILAAGLADPMHVLAALSISMLATYARARADSLGASAGRAYVGGRAERLLVLAVSGMAGYTEYGVIIVAVMAAAAAIQRAASAVRKLG
ncbi:CDP-diacylglycerol--glycerol-3-phosphate 3-phosphatidyltransferase [Nitrosopumilaceae archaeon]|nr:CDP-alcohol phosphatidyltransferase family protein [Nitrosopumilus sp.]CAI9831341.1 CDP-diacylglycerol--glycerol-3-phosphate 3-phosphatidyltransferase [Nitrosopumilaceae archaeon]MDA7944282.1 CDP-alcohol phosphatidyltransferase family protein [Nitrosopumilus sp.]MDA7954034.1 CDP-alcohol phosphatidyltransferase family protein [Nitrosopumilus sp.]MDA7972962.1 CDP-alcohol phosphatidyltransferase family protein [Nitrosopumilus sp.]